MNLTADWILPLVAGGVAAVVTVVLASRRPPPTMPHPVPTSTREPWLPWLLVGVVLAATSGLLTGRAGPAVAAFAISQGLGMMLRSRRRRQRADQEELHAAEAIGTASRALRAGIPVSGMLQMLADESRGQTRLALRELMQRESLGEELASCIRSVLLTSPLPALRAFGMVLSVQLSAGGNLADATDRLALSLVERSRVRRRARTIVAYSRNAANVLAVTPLLAVPMLTTTVDGYAQVLLDRPEGNMLLAVSAIMLVTGLLLIQRMSRVDRMPEAVNG